jgi:hypothetical protein
MISQIAACEMKESCHHSWAVSPASHEGLKTLLQSIHTFCIAPASHEPQENQDTTVG